MRSSRLQMNCSSASISSSRPQIGTVRHGSFAANHKGKKPGDRIILDGIEQILWPVHCVQNTHGAEFAPLFDSSRIAHVFHKGNRAKH